ncbi:two component transcriptional regulator, winged helix family [Candidatus Koribacter versatilis Ellin345]|uniref:Phosphate regulon transcriptional regulatory protein PhoB n=1 Tax=Koribacter versatilis (strain Ellin345) TaxID=204669 RepID=Q1IM38_KORVE|nr:response regulator transcription factor [Candidatus Koribacter versatilis]ABF42062.1 two component transcriptional regulator, winged helix family [Candidatus Koribacter versatilis Ellin345]
MNEHILLIEDEEALLTTLTDRLRAEGYSVEVARNGEEGYHHGTRNVFDLIILDIQLPKRNGFDVCRDIRQAGVATPILMLTARGQLVDKVVGLKIGADDYMTKPFEMIELMARIEALLRRSPMRPPEKEEVQQFGDLRVDLRGTEVTREGKPVALSAREFQLLRYLLENRGKTVSRGELLKEVWGYSASTYTRTVDMHIASLRQKIEPDPKQPQWVHTVPGLGYKFAAL